MDFSKTLIKCRTEIIEDYSEYNKKDFYHLGWTIIDALLKGEDSPGLTLFLADENSPPSNGKRNERKGLRSILS